VVSSLRSRSIVLLACAFALFVGGAGGTSGRQYHVSPRGDDGGDGSVDHPWKSLARAFDQLAAGDVLLLRGGTYYEHDLRVRARGTPEAPISIESYPGEHAVIDGGLQEFRDAPNQEWELVDERIQLYRSRRPVGGGLVRAWLPKYDIQLVEYSRDVDIESVNYDRVSGTQPFYMGPGVQLRTVNLPAIELEPALRTGEVDLALGHFPELVSAALYQQRLFTHTFVCIVRADHPSIGGELTVVAGSVESTTAAGAVDHTPV